MHNNDDGCELPRPYSLEGQRIIPKSYEDIKKLIVLAGVFFIFAILFIFMKLEVTVDNVFKWSPVVWFTGVLTCCLLMNFLCHCRRIYKRRQLMRIRRQEELLLSLNLASSFPCLSVLSHDLECCNGNGSLWPGTHRNSAMSLPTYSEVLAYPHHTINDAEAEQQTIYMTPITTSSNAEIAPPNYDEAIKMFTR